jgi:hypothetical protein
VTYDEALAKAFEVLFNALDNQRISLQGLTALQVLKIVKEYADCIHRVYNMGFASAFKGEPPAPSIMWDPKYSPTSSPK